MRRILGTELPSQLTRCSIAASVARGISSELSANLGHVAQLLELFEGCWIQAQTGARSSRNAPRPRKVLRTRGRNDRCLLRSRRTRSPHSLAGLVEDSARSDRWRGRTLTGGSLHLSGGTCRHRAGRRTPVLRRRLPPGRRWRSRHSQLDSGGHRRRSAAAAEPSLEPADL